MPVQRGRLAGPDRGGAGSRARSPREAALAGPRQRDFPRARGRGGGGRGMILSRPSPAVQPRGPSASGEKGRVRDFRMWAYVTAVILAGGVAVLVSLARFDVSRPALFV